MTRREETPRPHGRPKRRYNDSGHEWHSELRKSLCILGQTNVLLPRRGIGDYIIQALSGKEADNAPGYTTNVFQSRWPAQLHT